MPISKFSIGLNLPEKRVGGKFECNDDRGRPFRNGYRDADRFANTGHDSHLEDAEYVNAPFDQGVLGWARNEEEPSHLNGAKGHRDWACLYGCRHFVVDAEDQQSGGMEARPTMPV